MVIIVIHFPSIVSFLILAVDYTVSSTKKYFSGAGHNIFVGAGANSPLLLATRNSFFCGDRSSKTNKEDSTGVGRRYYG